MLVVAVVAAERAAGVIVAEAVVVKVGGCNGPR